MDDGCALCSRIKKIGADDDDFFVAELETGYLVLEYYQLLRGYAIFICRIHAAELHELEQQFRSRFLLEMSQVAESVYRSFGPVKMNYAMLGNQVPHLHWHLIPRYADDPNPKGAIWEVDRSVWASEKVIPSPAEREDLKRRLLSGLKSIQNLVIVSTFKDGLR